MNNRDLSRAALQEQGEVNQRLERLKQLDVVMQEQLHAFFYAARIDSIRRRQLQLRLNAHEAEEKKKHIEAEHDELILYYAAKEYELNVILALQFYTANGGEWSEAKAKHFWWQAQHLAQIYGAHLVPPHQVLEEYSKREWHCRYDAKKAEEMMNEMALVFASKNFNEKQYQARNDAQLASERCDWVMDKVSWGNAIRLAWQRLENLLNAIPRFTNQFIILLDNRMINTIFGFLSFGLYYLSLFTNAYRLYVTCSRRNEFLEENKLTYIESSLTQPSLFLKEQYKTISQTVNDSLWANLNCVSYFFSLGAAYLPLCMIGLALDVANEVYQHYHTIKSYSKLAKRIDAEIKRMDAKPSLSPNEKDELKRLQQLQIDVAAQKRLAIKRAVFNVVCLIAVVVGYALILSQPATVLTLVGASLVFGFGSVFMGLGRRLFNIIKNKMTPLTDEIHQDEIAKTQNQNHKSVVAEPSSPLSSSLTLDPVLSATATTASQVDSPNTDSPLPTAFQEDSPNTNSPLRTASANRASYATRRQAEGRSAPHSLQFYRQGKKAVAKDTPTMGPVMSPNSAPCRSL